MVRKENLNINLYGEIDHMYQSSNASCCQNSPSYRINSISIYIDDKTDTSCNEAGCIDLGYLSITRAEGIEHGCVSVEQQALLRQ